MESIWLLYCRFCVGWGVSQSTNSYGSVSGLARSVLCVLAVDCWCYVYLYTALYGAGGMRAALWPKMSQTEIEFRSDVASFVSWSLPGAAEREGERAVLVNTDRLRLATPFTDVVTKRDACLDFLSAVLVLVPLSKLCVCVCVLTWCVIVR